VEASCDCFILSVSVMNLSKKVLGSPEIDTRNPTVMSRSARKSLISINVRSSFSIAAWFAKDSCQHRCRDNLFNSSPPGWSVKEDTSKYLNFHYMYLQQMNMVATPKPRWSCVSRSFIFYCLHSQGHKWQNCHKYDSIAATFHNSYTHTQVGFTAVSHEWVNLHPWFSRITQVGRFPSIEMDK
jgi:hypothetical protein